MPVFKDGRRLTSLEEWGTYAHPKSKEHWVDDRSAKELARAWLSSERDALPSEVVAVLAPHVDFGPVISWRAEAEARLRFDSFPGEPRNSDLVVYADDASGAYVLAVEGKADEPYSETFAQAFANAMERRIENPRSNGIARAESLALTLLPPRANGMVHVGDLRYQLLTACAGAVAEAQRLGCPRAVMLVHEFVTIKTKDENHARNANDLSAFIRRISCGKDAEAKPGTLYGPYFTPGNPQIKLFVGKVVRQLR